MKIKKQRWISLGIWLFVFFGLPSVSWAKPLPDFHFAVRTQEGNTYYSLDYYAFENGAQLFLNKIKKVKNQEGEVEIVQEENFFIPLDANGGVLDVQVPIDETLPDGTILVGWKSLEDKAAMARAFNRVVNWIAKMPNAERFDFMVGIVGIFEDKKPAGLNPKHLLNQLVDTLKKDPLYTLSVEPEDKKPTTLGEIKSQGIERERSAPPDRSLGQPLLPKKRAEGQVPLAPETEHKRRRR